MNLREDVMMAARAAVWARVINVWYYAFPEDWRNKVLRDGARFLAHLQAGAVEVHGYIPERRVHPWDCYLNDEESRIFSHIYCREFSLYLNGEVPATAVEAALSELKRGPTAAGTVIWVVGLIARPAPPNIVRITRDVVQVVRSKLNTIGPSAVGGSKELEISREPENAAVLASVEVGNWIANVSKYPDDPDTSLPEMSGEVNISVYSGHVHVGIHRRDEGIIVWIYPARAPRAMRSAFVAAYAKWYGRLVAAALAHQLVEVGA
ncbi:MAG: hypothetical protein RXR82_07585 [Nitrososphaeria archaeon]